MMSKKIVILLSLFLSFITSCTIIETVDENIDKKEKYLARDKDEECYVNVVIKHNAQNVTLIIDSCFVHGFDLNLIEPTILEFGEEMICESIIMGLHYGNTLVFLLHGELESNGNRIYEGLIYIPTDYKIIPGNNFIELILYDRCPWYYLYNGVYIKVLQSIVFGAVVDDYETVEIDI